MSFVSKVKKILFDEEEVDVPVSSEELPERTLKDKKSKQTRETRTGFIDYHHEEEVEENPIKEVKVPGSVTNVEPKKFNFPEDDIFIEKTPEEQPINNDYGELDNLLKNVRSEESQNVNRYVDSSRREERMTREIKDYRKILGENKDKEEHKPFQNTPIISPVWGILDKNYKPEDIVEKKDELTKVNTGAALPRSFGPVSYNDEPLPGTLNNKKKNTKEGKEEKVEEKEDIVELSNSISKMIREEEPIEEKTISTEIEEVIEDDIVPTHTVEEISDDDDDEVIQTDGYDEYDSINSTYSVDTNIEDAFESTSEYESISNHDSELSQDETQDIDTLIDKKDDDDDDSGLDDTIETDLFNLIDSMYKDKEDE